MARAGGRAACGTICFRMICDTMNYLYFALEAEMKCIASVLGALAALCVAAPAWALSVPYPLPGGPSVSAYFAFSGSGPITGFVEAKPEFSSQAYFSAADLTFVDLSAELRIVAPGFLDLPVFQMVTFSEGVFSADVNGGPLAWDLIDAPAVRDPANYAYYDAFDLAMLPGENVFLLRVDHAPLPAGVFGIGRVFLGPNSAALVPAPGSLPLLGAALAGLIGLRRRRLRAVSPPARR